MASTNIVLKNTTTEAVTVYLTLGSNACNPAITHWSFIKKINDLQGSFSLGVSESKTFDAPDGNCLDGNFAFAVPPNNCPGSDSKAPSGINLAEFALNITGDDAQESIDISNVYGCNSAISFAMAGGGAWNAGTLHPNITSFSNKGLGQNIGIIGVYPYGCPYCEQAGGFSPCNPPVDCAPDPIVQQDGAICQVQRSATQCGGTVTIHYNGSLVCTS
ncbi:MAG: hypothetical protein AAF998_24780 [Bacteroidota bacterium]